MASSESFGGLSAGHAPCEAALLMTSAESLGGLSAGHAPCRSSQGEAALQWLGPSPLEAYQLATHPVELLF
ncbi:hypothetical protein MTO96_034135 [Rhipicephalus appendiculatus]